MMSEDTADDNMIPTHANGSDHLIGDRNATRSSTAPGFRLAVDPNEQNAFDVEGFDGLLGGGIRVHITEDASLSIAYRGTRMYCWLVRGYRGYSKPPALPVFMPTNVITRSPVELIWRTMPWDEGIIVVAGVGNLSGRGVMSLIDCIYEEYKSSGVSDHLIGNGIKCWESSSEGTEELDCCYIILTEKAIAQWERDSQTELAHSQLRAGKQRSK